MEKPAVMSLCTPQLFVCFGMASRWELSASKCDLFTRQYLRNIPDDEITRVLLRPNARLNFYSTIFRPAAARITRRPFPVTTADAAELMKLTILIRKYYFHFARPLCEGLFPLGVMLGNFG